MIQKQTKNFFRLALTLTAASGTLSFSTNTIASEIVNDITQLNPIAVNKVVKPQSISEISQLISRHLGPISIGGGRFSQGGQIATEDCLFLDMRGMDKILKLDLEKRHITVEAGITWRKIQEALDPKGLSLKIMQSFSNFTVGGSLSVNAHGRYVGQGPLIHSVQSIKIVLADGSIQEASRTRHPELFFGAIGGYGGIGVIAEATLDLVENSRIARDSVRINRTEYKDYFFKNIRNSKQAIFHNADIYPPHYSRVNAITWNLTDQPVTISEKFAPQENLSFFEQVLLSWYSFGPLGKQLREYLYDPLVFSRPQVEWRNYEASLDVAQLEPLSRKSTTYVLQEYFVPIQRFDEFSEKMVNVLKSHEVNVLNISIRHALPDPGTLLAWAPQEVFAFVIYYVQGVKDEDKKEVYCWTKKLIDSSIETGGTYYLPYQVIASDEQFHRAYPRSPEYFALKTKIDPNYKFRNKLLERYYRPVKQR